MDEALSGRLGPRHPGAGIALDQADRVTIRLSSARATISWDAREQLLARIGDHELGREICGRFDAVGASSPVKLDIAQKTYLLGVIASWQHERNELPDGIVDLRNALIDDVHDAEQRPG